MAKVTVHASDSPAAQVTARALKTFNIQDPQGRTIVLKKPGVLAQYRLIDVLGDSAKNETYVGMVLPLIYVASIDGEQIDIPESKLQVEALIQRLDEDGVTAVMKGVHEHFGPVDPEADKNRLKKA